MPAINSDAKLNPADILANDSTYRSIDFMHGIPFEMWPETDVTLILTITAHLILLVYIKLMTNLPPATLR